MTLTKPLRFLVCGRNEEILAVVKRLLEKQNWTVTVCTDTLAAQKMIKEGSHDVLFLSSGLSENEENLLKKIAAQGGNTIKTIEHYGGGSGLLLSEVYTTFPELTEG